MGSVLTLGLAAAGMTARFAPIIAPFLAKCAPFASGEAAARLEPVFGGGYIFTLLFYAGLPKSFKVSEIVEDRSLSNFSIPGGV
jgi:hypothetical protein